jgi:NADH-quinone oxidoreductase subunit B
MIHANMPRYDLERFGVAPRASPRQSDVMIVAGRSATRWLRAAPRLRTRCRSRATSSPWAAAPNAAAIIHYSYSVVRGCDRIVPVDIYVPDAPRLPKHCSTAYAIAAEDPPHRHDRALIIEQFGTRIAPREG